MNVFVAGATGVIGLPLLRLLHAAGHTVTGTTRSSEKAAAIKAQGVHAVVVDVFDAGALHRAVAAAQPAVIVHQLTDLPDTNDPANMAVMRERNSRVRIEGTRNLMAAAKVAGVRRVVAQSIAFIYAAGPKPYRETDALDQSEAHRVTLTGVAALEDAVLNTPVVEGIVLRYGRLYGPGTWFPAPSGAGTLTTDAAAQAAFLALTRGKTGIYNIAEDDGEFSIDKARRDLGFDPSFRLPGTHK